MANFKTAFVATGMVEGGYANDPTDRGGETWKGIARKKWPSWKGWVIVDTLRGKAGFPGSLAKSAQLQQQLEDFYKTNFWDRMRLDEVVHQPLAAKLYDIGVNTGSGTAVRMLQRVLNVANKNRQYYPDLAADGLIGPATIQAVNAHPRPIVVYRGINCLQGAYYIELAERDPTQEKYINGWLEQRVSGGVF